jgi:L-amino acid N-acyltransferase
MELIACTYASHGGEILDILNDAIENSTAIYDYQPRAPETMIGWFKTKDAGRFPVIGAVANGQLLGFASYGTFRAWPAYKYSVEHSVYVHKDHRGKGIGRLLMRALVETASERQYHIMVGGIDESNRSSISLHEKLGFVHVGTITQAAFKFGRWLDLGFYQLTLETPAVPLDG